MSHDQVVWLLTGKPAENGFNRSVDQWMTGWSAKASFNSWPGEFRCEFKSVVRFEISRVVFAWITRKIFENFFGKTRIFPFLISFWVLFLAGGTNSKVLYPAMVLSFPNSKVGTPSKILTWMLQYLTPLFLSFLSSTLNFEPDEVFKFFTDSIF